MLFHILGPLQLHSEIEIRSPAKRALLTAFLLRAGKPVGVREIAELLWDDPPASATANIRTHVTGLRRTLESVRPGLGHQVKTYRGGQGGYGIDIAPEEVDLTVFARRAKHGRSLLLCGQLDAAITELEAAVELCRGPVGHDLPPTRWFTAHVAGLNNACLDACQDLFTARVLAERTEMLAYRIGSLVAEAPYRQRLWELLAAVYCVEGDAAGALGVINNCQNLFADDLGLDLPPNIEALRAAALRWDRQEALRLVAVNALATDLDRHRVVA